MTLDNKQLYSCSCHGLLISDPKQLGKAEVCLTRILTYPLLPLKAKRLQWNAYRYGQYKVRNGNTHGKGRQWRNDAHLIRVKKVKTTTPTKKTA